MEQSRSTRPRHRIADRSRLRGGHARQVTAGTPFVLPKTRQPRRPVLALSSQNMKLRLDSKLAAIVTIDDVGHPRLIGEDEAGTARAVREPQAPRGGPSDNIQRNDRLEASTR
jgi:hypothetical protein